MKSERVYLGDGLYAEDDGFQIGVYANNGIADYSEVFFDPEVLDSFFIFIEKSRGLKITVTKELQEERKDG